MNRLGLTLAGAALLLAGCSHPELKRYGEDSVFDDTRVASLGDVGPQLDIYAYSPPTPPAPKPVPTALKDLSDRAQAAAVTAATQENPSLDALAGLASKPFETKPDDPAVTPSQSGATIDRTLVLNVSKGLAFKPSDRIAWTEVRIKPRGYVFAGYSVAATDTKVINVATLENTTTTSVKTSVTPTLLADVKGTGLVEGVFGSSKKATAPIEDTVTPLDVGIVPSQLRVTRESGRNGNVVGNTFVALSLDLTQAMNGPGSLNGLLVKKQTLVKDGAFVPAADAKVAVAMAQYPPACDLKADATFVYQIRTVTEGARSYVEGDDLATYTRDYKTLENVTLVRGQDVRPRLWAVYADHIDAAGTRKPVFVEGGTAFGELAPLLFTSYSEARLFAAWLAKTPGPRVGALSLMWNGAPVGAGAPAAYARIVASDC